ncbi:hypothetical protein KAI87_09320 [Myxococcota bacterium]|nr:hypothetical protein [Myxococcota bacterium]
MNLLALTAHRALLPVSTEASAAASNAAPSCGARPVGVEMAPLSYFERAPKAAGDIAPELDKAWATGRYAQMASPRLWPQAIDKLISYHVESGIYQDRFEGMERISGLGTHDAMEVHLAPNRNKVPANRVNNGACTCALCDPPEKEERGILWRDYKVLPNIYPYVGPESQHILITAAEHSPQRFSPKILGDMIDFQTFASGKRPMTLHYNGVAGNSQFHMHWQATRETLPVQRVLETGAVQKETLHSDKLGSVSTFDEGFFTGILVTGDRDYIVRQAGAIISGLDSDPQTAGAYNLVLLNRKNAQARLVITPRRKEQLRPDIDGFGPVGLGAFSLGGTMVIPKKEMPKDVAKFAIEAQKLTVVRASELSWLKEAVQVKAASSMPALQVFKWSKTPEPLGISA